MTRLPGAARTGAGSPGARVDHLQARLEPRELGIELRRGSGITAASASSCCSARRSSLPVSL